MICQKCGAEVPDGYEYCMKCGAKVNVTQDEAESSEKKAVSKIKANKKVLIAAVGAMVVILIAVVLAFGLKRSTEKNGYFANIPWGTDIKTVKKQVDKTFKCESRIGESNDSIIAVTKNYDGMQGVGTVTVLFCEDEGTLNKVSVKFTVDDDSSYTYGKVVKQLVKKYNKLFGKADNSDVFSYKWKTKNSTITLVIFSEDMIMLVYNK